MSEVFEFKTTPFVWKPRDVSVACRKCGAAEGTGCTGRGTYAPSGTHGRRILDVALAAAREGGAL